MTVQLIALKPLRMFGESVDAGNIVETSIQTARALVRNGRAKAANPRDLALLLDEGRASLDRPRMTLVRRR